MGLVKWRIPLDPVQYHPTIAMEKTGLKPESQVEFVEKGETTFLYLRPIAN